MWQAIGGYTMKLMNLAPAKFVHFGSIPEILELVNRGVSEYELLGWKRQVASSLPGPEIAAYASVLRQGAKVGQGTYPEVSYVHRGAVRREKLLWENCEGFEAKGIQYLVIKRNEVARYYPEPSLRQMEDGHAGACVRQG